MTQCVTLMLSCKELKESAVHGFASGAYSNVFKQASHLPKAETTTIPRLIDNQYNHQLLKSRERRRGGKKYFLFFTKEDIDHQKKCRIHSKQS